MYLTKETFAHPGSTLLFDIHPLQLQYSVCAEASRKVRANSCERDTLNTHPRSNDSECSKQKEELTVFGTAQSPTKTSQYGVHDMAFISSGIAK